MALSGTTTTGYFGNSHYYIQVRWTATQSTAGNYSTVIGELWFGSDSSWDIYTGNHTGTITIDGTTSTFSVDCDTSGGSWQKLGSYTKQVNHNSDGTKTFSISGTYDLSGITISNAMGKATSSDSFTLNPIPRETTYSGTPNWTVAGATAFTMNFNKAYTGYTTDVVIKVNAVAIKTITGITGTAYTVTWTNTEIQNILVELNKDTTNWNQASTIEITTKSGTTTIGSVKTATGTFTAPAVTSVGGTSFTIGNSTTVTMGTETNTAFVYDLTATLGSYTKTLLTKGGYAASTAWATSTDATSLYGQLASATSGTVTYTLTTYWANGATYTKVRSATSTAVTATVDTTTQRPSFAATGLTYYDSDTSVTALTGATSGAAYLCVVQSESTLVVSLPVGGLATPSSGTSISKYTCTFYGMSKPSSAASTTVAQTFTFTATDLATANNTADAVVTVTDARGVSSSANLSINVVPYAKPAVTATALRNDGFSTPVTLKLSGSISALNVNGVNKNSVSTMTYQYRVTGGTYNAVTNFTAGTAVFPKYAANDVALATQLSSTNSYDVSFAVKDALNNTTTVVQTVGKGSPIFFIDSTKSSVGVNTIPTSDSSFEVAGHFVKTGGGYLDLGNTAIVMDDAGSNGATDGTNYDHIWHEDGTNTWHFHSDDTYKKTGTSKAKIHTGTLDTDGSIKVTRTGGQTLQLIQSDYVTGGGAYNYIGFCDDLGAWKSFVGYSSGKTGDFTISTTTGNIVLTSTTGSATLNGKALSTIESQGSNTNGAYIRYVDGTQICWITTSVTNQAIGSPYITFYDRDSNVRGTWQGTRTWTFPAAFIARPVVSCTEFKWGTGASWGGTAGAASASLVVLRGWDNAERLTGTNVDISAIAIGTWK